MFAVKILTIGKCKEPWLEAAIKEYEKRLSPSMKISWIYAKNDKDLEILALKNSPYICLDLQGKILTSEELSKELIHILEQKGAKITLIIGGPEGILPTIIEKSELNLSLSKLTFTSQITRLILVEQLYRTVQISQKTKYHK